MTPSPVLDRVDSRGPRSRFYIMHQHRHPYRADYGPQAQHRHRQAGHRLHPQQCNVEDNDDENDDNRSVVSEQLSSMVPSAASPRSDVPTFTSYRRVSAPLPSVDLDTTAGHQGHPPSAIHRSPSPSRSALHFQSRLHGSFYPLGPDSAFGRPKNAIHDYPFPDAKMPRGFSDTKGSPLRGEEDQNGAATACQTSVAPSAPFSFVRNTGLSPRKMMEEQQPLISEMVPQEVATAPIASGKRMLLPPSSAPLTSWRDPLSVPPSSNMAVSELAPAPSPEPFSRGGRPLGPSNEAAADDKQDQEEGEDERSQKDEDQGTSAQEGGRRGVFTTTATARGAFKPGTEPGQLIARSSAEGPHNVRPPTHVLHPERPFAPAATALTMPLWQEEGARMERVGRESQRQFGHQMLAQEQELELKQEQQQHQMQMQMHPWLTRDRDTADRERMGQQQHPTRYPEQDEQQQQQQQQYHHHYHHDSRYGTTPPISSIVDGRSSATMDDKDATTRLTHSPSPPPAPDASQTSHQQLYQREQHQRQGPSPSSALTPAAAPPPPPPPPPPPLRPTAAAIPRSHPPHWDSPFHHASDARCGPSEMAYPSMSSPMSHSGRPMSGGIPPATSSSMSPLSGANGSRMHGPGPGSALPNDTGMRIRYSISEGIQPPPPPPPHGYSVARGTGSVPYQSQQPSPIPPHQRNHQAAADGSARSSHPFYVQNATQGHPDAQPQPQQQHPSPVSQQHLRSSYPPLQTQVPPRHHPFHPQDAPSTLPFQSSPSVSASTNSITSAAGSKRRSVADLLFVPVKSKDRRSGSFSSASGFESSASPWSSAISSTSPYSGTPKQPSNFPHSNPPPPLSSPSRAGSTSSSSGAPLLAAAALATTPKGGKNGSTPSTPRSGKGSSGPKTFQCTGYPGCNMVFTRSEHLARHERKHTGEKPFKCIVANCTRTFSRYDNMIQHTQTHSDRSKREIDVHRMNSAHPPPSMGMANRMGGYGRGNSALPRAYTHGSMVPSAMSSPSVFATEPPNGSTSPWNGYGSQAMQGHYSPAPLPAGPRAMHSKSLSSLRSGVDPNSPAFGMDPRTLDEERRRKTGAMIHAHPPSHPYQQSPHPPFQSIHGGQEMGAHEAHRQASLSSRPSEGPMLNAAARPGSASGPPGGGAIGLGVSPLTPSPSHSQPLPYVERLTPYEHEMLMEHRRSLAGTPDLAPSGSPASWGTGPRGSVSFGRGSGSSGHQQQSHQQPLSQIHYLTSEEKERLRQHRRSTPDPIYELSSKRSSMDSAEPTTTQPLPSRDTKSGMQWYSQTSTPQLSSASTPRVTEGARLGSQESLGHPPFPPQPQPQPQTQPRAHSIPLPYPLAVGRLPATPAATPGGSMPVISMSSPSPVTASPSTTSSHISTSPRTVLPPIIGMHSSSRFQQSPQAPSAHLPPPLPKAGIHPFSRSNSISHPFIHDSNSHAEADDDVGEPVALSASPSDMDIRHDSFTSSQRQWKWTKKSVPTGYGSGSSEQHLRRPSGMTMLLNSNDRPPNVQQLPPAALEILSQDFAPVTRSHVEKYLRRMDEKEYRRLESIVSEKYADHLEAHPWFLNNLTAMLCVIQEGDSDVQVKGPPSQGETDKSMVMDIDTAPPSSTRPALTFERIHLEKLSCQPTEQSWTKGLQGLTLTPHEEISNFVALFSEQKQHGDQSDNQFLPGRFNLPPHAYSLKDLLSKNFVVSAEPTQWGLYRFQEYPDLQFVVLKSVIQEYKRIKESIKAARHPSDNESHEEGDGDGDVDMAVDDRGSGNAAAKPRYRMALTLVEESGEQVPREVLETFGQFDWTLSGHVHRPCFVEQPPMGLSRSTKVWTRFDRLMWHPTESEILHRDYEMLLPPARLMDAQQQDRDEKRTDDDEAEAIAARFVHTDSLAPAILAFIWADMYMTYKTTGSLRHLEGDLPDSEEALANEEDEYGEYDDVAGEEEEEYGDEGKEKVEALRPHVTQDAEQQDAEDDDGADRISMPDSFKRWRMTRRSTTDSNSTIASRRESMMPPLPLAMSTIPAVPTTSTPTTSAIRSMTGSTVTPVEEQDEPLATPSVGKSSSICPTSMASPVSSMSAASAAAGRRISIAELCSPMLTLGNTSNASTNNSSK